MLAELDTFIHTHQQPLLALYLFCLLCTLLAFVVLVLRWSRTQEQVPAPGMDILHRGGLTPGLAIVIGLLFLLLFLPFVVDNLKALDRVLVRNPEAWLLGIFPLAGLGLIGYGTRLLWRSRRHRERLLVHQANLSPAGLVTGEFVIEHATRAEQCARIHLVLQDAHVFHWLGGERQLFQHSIWSDSQEAPVRVRGERRIVPFQFRLPDRLPKEGSQWQRREWVVVLELPGYGRATRVLQAEKGRGSVNKRLSLKGLWTRRTPVQPTPGGAPPYRPFATDVPGRNPLLELAGALFVAVFPWLFWFAMDGNERPWAHLGTALPPVLLQGGAVLCLFCTLLFALLRWALSDSDENDMSEPGRKWQRLARVGLPIVLAGDGILLAAGAGYLSNTRLRLDPDAIERLLLHGFVGMFLWVGMLTLVLTCASLVRRPRR